MKTQAWIEIGQSNIFHLIKMEANKQVLHEVVFSFLRRKSASTIRWLPTLDELEVFSEYLKLIRALCEYKIYPTKQQLEIILSQDQITVFDLLFRNEYGLCAQLPKFELQQQTMDEIAEILTRQLIHTKTKEATLHFLIASRRTNQKIMVVGK